MLGAMTFPKRAGFLFAVVLALTGMSSIATAQFASGGSTGTTSTTTATLGDADIFIGVQKTANVNLTDRDRGQFLNQANCQCETDVWVKAVILPSAAARAATISPSASVSLYVGNICDPTSTISCCHRLASGVPFSEFRQFGITAKTSVDILMRDWSPTSGSCQNTIGPTVTPTDPVCGLLSTGTGGSTATGGTSGGGAGGSGGAGGAVETSTGGASGTVVTATSPHGACVSTITQNITVFIGTLGEGTRDVGSKTLGFSVDPVPPCAVPGVVAAPVNEALQLSWTGLSIAEAADLLGYQALCTRGDVTQVFKDGSFSPAFDACARTASGWPTSATMPDRTAFVCSDLLPTSATSVRLKILENDISYLVGVAAIDKQRNASVVTPSLGIPILTKDFYYEYRHGDPQGGSIGGYCAVSGSGSSGWLAGVMGTLLALVLVRRRQRGRR